jgi:hypothetical protein
MSDYSLYQNIWHSNEMKLLMVYNICKYPRVQDMCSSPLSQLSSCSPGVKRNSFVNK